MALKTIVNNLANLKTLAMSTKINKDEKIVFMPQFRTQFNGVQAPDHIRYEIAKGTSQTVPDQTMSVKEIMRRYAQGLPIQGEKVPLYDIDDDTPDIRRLDLSEIQEYAEEALSKRQSAEQEINQKNKEREARKKEKELRQKIEEEKSEKSTNNP